MPALRDICRSEDASCCVCGEHDCFVSLSPRGETVLFIDGQEAVASGERCDCIMVLRRMRDNTIVLEVYSVELKSIHKIKQASNGALNSDSLRQKCWNCLQWILNIIGRFTTARNPLAMTVGYCVIAIPSNVFEKVFTLLRREKRKLLPRNAESVRIIACGGSPTEQVLWEFK